MLTIRQKHEKALKVIMETGIDIEDVAKVVSENQQFTDDGWYMGPKEKVLGVTGKNGKTIKLVHGGSITMIQSPCCRKKNISCGFWTGLLVGIIGS